MATVAKVRVKVSDITYHCGIGLLIRILLCVYGVIHDSYIRFRVPYTDKDYNVFTLAAREVVSQRTPYNYKEYRYSPFIAYLLTPNVLLHPVFGKVLASAFDVLLAYCIYKTVLLVYNHQKKALQCAQLWLYNPLPIVICTRGNIDSISSLVVLLTLLYHLRQNYVVSGALLALSVHLRLYPIVFLPSYVLTAGRFSAHDTLKSTFKHKLKFAASFAAALVVLTGVFYYIYGTKFVDSSIKYHIERHDIRHNFSLYFYLQYLDHFVPSYVSKNINVLDPEVVKNLLIIVPNLVLQFAITLKYNTLNHLPFGVFCSAFTFVIFNKVLTSQYFLWYLSLLPLFLPSIILSTKKVVAIVASWIGTQALWLLGAYLLEYQGYNDFVFIHACSVAFFVVNVLILTTFVNNYNAYYVKKVD